MHVLMNVLPHIPSRITITPAHRCEVPTGTKDPASLSENHDINRVVSLTVAQRCGPVCEHTIVKGFELLGTIQGNGRNLVGFCKQQLVSHVALTPNERSSVGSRQAPVHSSKELLPVLLASIIA